MDALGDAVDTCRSDCEYVMSAISNKSETLVEAFNQKYREFTKLKDEMAAFANEAVEVCGQGIADIAPCLLHVEELEDKVSFSVLIRSHTAINSRSHTVIQSDVNLLQNTGLRCVKSSLFADFTVTLIQNTTFLKLRCLSIDPKTWIFLVRVCIQVDHRQSLHEIASMAGHSSAKDARTPQV